MKHVHQLLWAATAVLFAADAPGADEAKKGPPDDNFDKYVRETSVPAVPAATLLGVDKSKIVEVASINKFSSTLTAARGAEEAGTPFGIDFSPAQLFADKGGMLARSVKSSSYANDQMARVLARTRLSLATNKRDNSKQTAVGLYTRPIDLRDPFVSRELHVCASDFHDADSTLRRQLPDTSLDDVKDLRPDDARRLALAFLPHIARLRLLVDTARESGGDPLAHAQELKRLEVHQANADRISRSSSNLSAEDVKALREAAGALKASAEKNAQELKPRRELLVQVHEKCALRATDNLWNRSYLALGFTSGQSKAADASKPLDHKPGRAAWVTFAYGFEGFKNLWKGEADWQRAGPLASEEKTLLRDTSRLTLHYARNSGGAALVDGVMQSTAGSVAGLGFDFMGDDKARRYSLQVARSSAGEGVGRKIERTAVIGLDLKVQESTWFGLSWGRRSVKEGDKDNEVKAQLKWAFSDAAWLKP